MQNNSVRVLVIGMSPQKGGIESLLMHFFRNTDREKVQFSLLTFCPKCVYESEIQSFGIPVYHITRRGVNPIKNYTELTEFYKAHAEEYDFIWYHLSSASNCLPVTLAKKYTNAKIICHSHGTAFESNPLVRPIHSVLDKINYPKLMRATDICFACSQAAGKWLFKNTDKPIHIVRNGTDTSQFRFNAEKRAAIRESLGIFASQPVLGHAGRFCEAKNHTFLLEIFCELCRDLPDCILLLAGEGELQTAMEEKAKALGISQKVRFLGFRSDFADLLQGMDLFCMPSLYEGLPLTVVEAQAAGVPCLLSDTIPKECAITDIVSFLSLEQSAAAWAKEIQTLLTRNLERARYADCVKNKGYDIFDTVAEVTDYFCENVV